MAFFASLVGIFLVMHGYSLSIKLEITIFLEMQFNFDIQVSRSCDSEAKNKMDHEKRKLVIFTRDSLQHFMWVL
jgi:hypothetical protein